MKTLNSGIRIVQDSGPVCQQTCISKKVLEQEHLKRSLIGSKISKKELVPYNKTSKSSKIEILYAKKVPDSRSSTS